MGIFDFIGGIVNTAVNAGQNRRNRKAQQRENALDRQFNAEQSQLARDWQEDMYNRYSSPSAMVNQYEEAGLNPVLAAGAGQGVTFSGSTAHSSSSSLPPSQMLDLIGPISEILNLKEDIATKRKQRNVLDSQINLNNSAAEKNRVDAAGTEIENRFKPQMLEQQYKQGELNIQNTEKGLTLLAERINTEKTVQDLNKDELLNNAVNRLVGMRTANKILEETNTEVLKQVTEQLRAANLAVDTYSKAAGIIRLQIQNYVDCASLVLKDKEVNANVRKVNAEALEQEIDNKYYQKYCFKPQPGLYGIIMQMLMNIPESGEKLLEEVGKGIKYLDENSDPTYVPNNK